MYEMDFIFLLHVLQKWHIVPLIFNQRQGSMQKHCKKDYSLSEGMVYRSLLHSVQAC